MCTRTDKYQSKGSSGQSAASHVCENVVARTLTTHRIDLSKISADRTVKLVLCSSSDAERMQSCRILRRHRTVTAAELVMR